MAQTLLAYARATFPTHEIRSVGQRGGLPLGENTVVATFSTVGDAAAARGRLPSDVQDGMVELAELRSSGSRTTAPEPSAAAQIRPWSNKVAVTTGAIVGAVLGVGVSVLLDIDAFAVGVVTVFGALLGGLVGFYSAGMGWFRGERSDAERDTQGDESLGLLAAVPHDGHEANTIARRMMAAGALDVRIVDSDGFWHAPSAD